MLSQPILRGSSLDSKTIDFNGRTYNVVSDSEKINFEAHGFFAKSIFEGNHHLDPNMAMNLVSLGINRNFIDDTFTLKTLKFPYEDRGIIALSANNKATAWEGNAAIQDHDWISARPFALNEETFLKSSSWTTSYSPRDEIEKANFVLSIFPHIAPLKPNFMLNQNEVLKLNLIKDIRFGMNIAPNISTSEPKIPITDSQLNPYVDYAAIYVVPKSIDQLTHRVNIADLYVEYNSIDAGNPEINESTVNHFFKFTDEIKYKSSSFTGDLKALYSNKIGSQFTTKETTAQGMHNTKLRKLGSLDLVESTAYNYENSKTEISKDGEAQMGELLPFNFKGNYSNNFTLGISYILKNINISTSEYISQAILDPYSGKVQLNIYKGDKQDMPMFKLKTQQVKDFRTALAEQKFIELEGIRRFSNE